MKHGKYEKNIPPAAPRKNGLILIAALALLTAVSIGSTLAYFFNTSEPVINTFQAGSVGANIYEEVSANAKTSITVSNTGKSPVYVRVRLLCYWLDEDNSIAPKDSTSVSISPNSGWVENGGYYYYTSPVAGGSATANMLAAPLAMTTEDGYRQVIEVLAETVQATPADAALGLWGVDPSSLGKEATQ